MYQEDGRLDDALRLALTAKEGRRRSPAVNDTLGWIYVRKDRPLDALPLLAESAHDDPDNPLYRYHLAVAYWKAGYPAQARQAVSIALASPRPFEARDASFALAKQLAVTPSPAQHGQN